AGGGGCFCRPAVRYRRVSGFNLERVEALKLAIRNGELKMDTGKIADALINEAQQDLQSN
ncbi:flagellar biosynthesis anti-sigma factor FlgM, partial [Escherichia sp. R-CC3]